jgi:hypothetical protein
MGQEAVNKKQKIGKEAMEEETKNRREEEKIIEIKSR